MGKKMNNNASTSRRQRRQQKKSTQCNNDNAASSTPAQHQQQQQRITVNNILEKLEAAAASLEEIRKFTQQQVSLDEIKFTQEGMSRRISDLEEQIKFSCSKIFEPVGFLLERAIRRKSHYGVAELLAKVPAERKKIVVAKELAARSVDENPSLLATLLFEEDSYYHSFNFDRLLFPYDGFKSESHDLQERIKLRDDAIRNNDALLNAISKLPPTVEIWNAWRQCSEQRQTESISKKCCGEIWFASLRHLEDDARDIITDDILGIVSTTCAEVIDLDLHDCAAITDVGLRHLAQLTSLQRLNLRGCHQITDSGLQRHFSSLTALRFLTVPKHITRDTMRKIQKFVPKIAVCREE